MKKIEKGKLFLKQNLDIFSCPFCHENINALENNSLICDNQHVINLNKKGTVNFLTHSQKGDYDSKEMWQARRNILQKGLFDKIIEEILKEMPNEKVNLIDVGCGEGTPLVKLTEKRPQFKDAMVGFDISKDSINLATDNQKDIFFCIADLANLPFATNKIDAIIDIFSPSSYKEFNRVLSDKGKVYKIVPNSDYLKELRSLLYDKSSEHATYSNQKVVELFFENYPQAQKKEIKYKFKLTDDDFLDLLEMTPLKWGASDEKIADVKQHPLNEITVDVVLLIS